MALDTVLKRGRQYWANHQQFLRQSGGKTEIVVGDSFSRPPMDVLRRDTATSFRTGTTLWGLAKGSQEGTTPEYQQQLEQADSAGEGRVVLRVLQQDSRKWGHDRGGAEYGNQQKRGAGGAGREPKGVQLTPSTVPNLEGPIHPFEQRQPDNNNNNNNNNNNSSNTAKAHWQHHHLREPHQAKYSPAAWKLFQDCRANWRRPITAGEIWTLHLAGLWTPLASMTAGDRIEREYSRTSPSRPQLSYHGPTSDGCGTCYRPVRAGSRQAGRKRGGCGT